jgi:hypothetical protein
VQDPDRIYDICQAIKAAIVAYYADPANAVPEEHELPERQYVADSHLAIVLDCPQLAVACEVTTGYEGDPSLATAIGQFRGAGHAMRAGTFVITLARCSAPQDEDEPTDVEDEEDSARAVYADATRILNALITAEKAGTLPGCGQVAFLSWRPAEEVNAQWAAGVLRVQIGLVG